MINFMFTKQRTINEWFGTVELVYEKYTVPTWEAEVKHLPSSQFC